MWPSFSFGNPTPVSLTVINTCPVSVISDFTTSSPPASFIASMALSMRFITTCCNCTRSPITHGAFSLSCKCTPTEYCRAWFWNIRLVSLKQLQAHFRVHHRGGNWLLDFVSQGRRHLSHCAHAIHVREFRLELA